MSQDFVYRHRQIGWTLLCSMAIPFLVIAALSGLAGGTDRNARNIHALMEFWPVIVGILAIVAVMFSSLEVRIDETVLTIRFGPGLLSKSWDIVDLEHAIPTRTTIAQGWGIHKRGGVTCYNVSGFNGVRIALKTGQHFIIGSDDAAHLATVLNQKIQQLAPPAR